MMAIPFYVYLLFFLLVFMGIKRCHPRIMKVERLFVAPLIFILLSIRGTNSLFLIQFVDILMWILGCCIGVILGYFHVSNRTIKADRNNRLIELPGDWSILILILIIFAFEFFVHYAIEAGWKISTALSFKYISLLILGMIAGTSMGRAFHYYLKYATSTVSISLTDK